MKLLFTGHNDRYAIEQKSATKSEARQKSAGGVCPHCGAGLEREDYEFCPVCGGKLVDYCTFCGAARGARRRELKSRMPR